MRWRLRARRLSVDVGDKHLVLRSRKRHPLRRLMGGVSLGMSAMRLFKLFVGQRPQAACFAAAHSEEAA